MELPADDAMKTVVYATPICSIGTTSAITVIPTTQMIVSEIACTNLDANSTNTGLRQSTIVSGQIIQMFESTYATAPSLCKRYREGMPPKPKVANSSSKMTYPQSVRGEFEAPN